MMKKLILLLIASGLTGCAQMPIGDQSQYIAYLQHRIEVLEKRTERNESAIIGVNRRVNGLADLVADPSNSESSQPPRKGR